MKVYKKVGLVFFAIAVILMISVSWMGYMVQKQAKRVFCERSTEIEKLFKNIVKMEGEKHRIFVYDYTYWDEMIAFVKTPDPVWGIQNIDEGIKTYEVDIAWVCRTDGSIVYSKSKSNFKSLPLKAAENVAAFDKSRLTHFFVVDTRGVIEIQGATIHPTNDPERKTPPQGLFFAGRLWDQALLQNLSELTASDVRLVVGEEIFERAKKPVSLPSTINFSMPLSDINGAPVARLDFIRKSPILEQIHQESKNQFYMLILVLTLLWVLVLYLLYCWINRPLLAISNALRDENPSRLSEYQKKTNEFGEISRLIQKFFLQKEELVREISERKRFQASMVESQKLEALGKMAGAIAHDFNNQLTTIRGFCELLMTEIDPKTSMGGYVKEIQAASERSTAFTSQLLSFSSKHIVIKQVMNLNQLISGLITMLNVTIGEKYHLEVQLSPDLYECEVAQAQIEQAIINITMNAKDAMPNGGEINITTKNVSVSQEMSECSQFHEIHPGDYAVIEISDNGIGLSEEVKKHLFEPFFTTKEIGKGAGLGLASAFTNVRQHDGLIQVESQLGQGATFRIYLPKKNMSVAIEVPTKPLVETLGGKETILLAEDEESVRKVIETMLASKGYRVFSAHCGKQALDIAQSSTETIHILLTDMVMSDMKGVELGQKIKSIQPQIKVLYMSGYASLDEEDQARREMPNFLQKPFSQQVLMAKIRETLKLHSS